jgi:hypothetical protein
VIKEVEAYRRIETRKFVNLAVHFGSIRTFAEAAQTLGEDVRDVTMRESI